MLQLLLVGASIYLQKKVVMVIKKSKSILRAALDDDLIIEVKIAAIKAKSTPNKIVEIALRNYLNAKDAEAI